MFYGKIRTRALLFAATKLQEKTEKMSVFQKKTNDIKLREQKSWEPPLNFYQTINDD